MPTACELTHFYLGTLAAFVLLLICAPVIARLALMRHQQNTLDMELWAIAQRLVYPKRTPSQHPPFPFKGTSATVKPASFLYHRLARDPQLRQLVKRWAR